MSKYAIKMTYGGAGKPESRFFGGWVEKANAEEIAYLWRVKVAGRFPGNVNFEVVEIESRDISMRKLREDLEKVGMN